MDPEQTFITSLLPGAHVSPCLRFILGRAHIVYSLSSNGYARDHHPGDSRSLVHPAAKAHGGVVSVAPRLVKHICTQQSTHANGSC